MDDLSSENVTSYALDLPGFGRSALPRGAFTIHDFAEVVADFIHKLDLKKVILVGHSFGGRVSIKLAAEHPDLIDKLILVDSAGIKLDEARSNIMGTAAKVLKPLFRPKFMKGIRHKIYESIGSVDYVATPELTQIYLEATREDLRKHFKDISVPTLLVWGEKDSSTPIEIANIMHKEIKNSDLIVFAGASHFSFLDEPEKFLKELIKFIR